MSASELGFHHALVQTARRLQQKKRRLEQRCFLVEGPQLVAAALEAGAPLERAFIWPEGAAAIVAGLEAAQVPVSFVDRRTLESLAQTQSPQGVVAVARFLHHTADELARLATAARALVLVLHDLSDPGNAGTLVRSAEAFGVRAVCFGPHAVDPYNDKVVRSSMGSLFRVPIVWYQSWDDFVQAATGANLALVGGAPGQTDVRSITTPPRVALVIGEERRGLGGLPSDDLACVVGIAHSPTVESLNAAVAGSILLYELSRERVL